MVRNSILYGTLFFPTKESQFSRSLPKRASLAFFFSHCIVYSDWLISDPNKHNRWLSDGSFRIWFRFLKYGVDLILHSKGVNLRDTNMDHPSPYSPCPLQTDQLRNTQVYIKKSWLHKSKVRTLAGDHRQTNNWRDRLYHIYYLSALWSINIKFRTSNLSVTTQLDREAGIGTFFQSVQWDSG